MPINIDNLIEKHLPTLAKILGKGKGGKPLPSAVGLSIGNENLYAIEVIQSKDVYYLTNFAHRDIEPGHKHLALNLKEMFKEHKFSSNRVNTSISGPSVISRTIQMPRMAQKDLRSTLKFEAEKYIPFDMDDVIFDFYKPEIETDTQSKIMKVLLVAAKKSEISKIMEPLYEAGLKISSITTDSLAMINSFSAAYPEKNKEILAFLDIGTSSSTLTIVSDGMPVMVRDISFGGYDITEAIRTKKDVTFDEATKIKYKATDRTDDEQKIINDSLEYLVSELRVSLSYYYNQTRDAGEINTLYASGGTCKLKQFQELLSEKLDISITFWNPLNGFIIDESIDKNMLVENTYNLPVGVGLALS